MDSLLAPSAILLQVRHHNQFLHHHPLNASLGPHLGQGMVFDRSFPRALLTSCSPFDGYDWMYSPRSRASSTASASLTPKANHHDLPNDNCIAMVGSAVNGIESLLAPQRRMVEYKERGRKDSMADKQISRIKNLHTYGIYRL